MALVAAVVLAAGAASRFGSPKLAAELEGKPVLQHVLDRLHEAGVQDPIVVVPPDATALEAAIAWRGARPIVNPEPQRGLSGSLRIGWSAALEATAQPDAVLVVLGDQPRLSAALVRRLLAEPLDPSRPLVVPRYAGGGGGNPVRIEAEAAGLVDSAAGDRGLGPLIAERPDLVRWLDAAGTNPDIDTPADLARLERP